MATTSGTPAWIATAETLLFPAVGLLAARFWPHLSSAAAQAVVILAGLVVGGIVRGARVVSENGISKAGIVKSVSDEEAWIKGNAPAIKAAYEAAVPAIDTIKGGAAAIAAAQSTLAAATAAVLSVPVDQRNAVIGVLRDYLPGVVPAAGPPAYVVPAVSAPAPVVGVNV